MTLRLAILLTLAAAATPLRHGAALAQRRSAPRACRACRMAALPLGASVSALTSSNRAAIDELAQRTASVRDEEHDELWLLRFVLDSPSVDAAEASVREVLEWRRGEGKPIVTAAAAAVEQATAGGGWNNEAVLSAAPNAARVRAHIGASQCQSMASPGGSLVYVIRAAAIDDKQLMASVSTDELADFFTYVKEARAAHTRGRRAAAAR